MAFQPALDRFFRRQVAINYICAGFDMMSEKIRETRTRLQPVGNCREKLFQSLIGQNQPVFLIEENNPKRKTLDSILELGSCLMQIVNQPAILIVMLQCSPHGPALKARKQRDQPEDDDNNDGGRDHLRLPQEWHSQANSTWDEKGSHCVFAGSQGNGPGNACCGGNKDCKKNCRRDCRLNQKRAGCAPVQADQCSRNCGS